MELSVPQMDSAGARTPQHRRRRAQMAKELSCRTAVGCAGSVNAAGGGAGQLAQG